MLTFEPIIRKKYPLQYVLTAEDKKKLLAANKDNTNISYLSLLKEMFTYKHLTVEDYLKGWSGIVLFQIK